MMASEVWLSNNIELLPCPFCGGPARYLVRPQGSGHGESYDGVAIGCPECQAYVTRSSYTGHQVAERTKDVIRIWNQRAPESPQEPSAPSQP